MRMNEIALAVKAAGEQEKSTNHAFLFYGPPKSGKTELVATIAKSPEYDNIWWFDLENGSDTILRMQRDGKLTLDDLKKIILIKIPDTREDPTAIDTLLKTLASKAGCTLCEAHGRANCTECTKANAPREHFQYNKLTKRDAIVIDTLSQAGTSALNMACRGRSSDYKPGFDEYGAMGKWLSDILTVVQAAQFCDIYCITHVMIMEDENKNDLYYPLCGTKPFSANVAKFFGTVVYVTKKLKKHRAESSTISSMVTFAGSRLGIEMEKCKELDLVQALKDAGFFPTRDDGAVVAPATPVKEEPAEKPPAVSRFAERLAAASSKHE